MKKNKDRPNRFKELRKQAEKRLLERDVDLCLKIDIANNLGSKCPIGKKEG